MSEGESSTPSRGQTNTRRGARSRGRGRGRGRGSTVATNDNPAPIKAAPPLVPVVAWTSKPPISAAAKPPPSNAPQPSSNHSEPSAIARGQGPSLNRGRGRGNRGGLGKYLRARGRGRGGGRPAEFGQRLLLDGEGPEDEEAAEEERRKYSRRQLGTNAARYEEKKPDPTNEDDDNGEEDAVAQELARFLEKQRLTGTDKLPLIRPQQDDDVDYTLAHISSRGIVELKPEVEELEWDDELEAMAREKDEADANRELTARFRAKSDNLKRKPIAPTKRDRKMEASYVAAPALPTEQPKDEKKVMQEFLDDLIS